MVFNAGFQPPRPDGSVGLAAPSELSTGGEVLVDFEGSVGGYRLRLIAARGVSVDLGPGMERVRHRADLVQNFDPGREERVWNEYVTGRILSKISIQDAKSARMLDNLKNAHRRG
jgi:hypothetical protein